MNCSQCNKAFAPKPRAHRQIYCSKACNQLAYYARNISRIKESQRNRVAADPERFKEYKRRWNQSDKGVANRKDWYEKNKPAIFSRILAKSDYNEQQRYSCRARRVLRANRERVCEKCSTIAGIIDAHHINKPRSDNRLENLAWLCRKCHAVTHITQ